MVFMHGLGGSTNAFQPLVSQFSSTHTMLRFDFFGSGLSKFGAKAKTLSIPYFVADLEDLLSSKGATGEAAFLIGHSLGSIVTMHYAAKHAKTSGIILIGPGRSASHIPFVVERMLGMARKARSGIEYLMDSTVTNNIAPSSSDLVRTVVRQMISSQDGEGYAATCEAVCSMDHVDPDYSAIKCPVLLIAGDQDMISPLSRSQELAELIGAGTKERNVQIQVVKSGHQQVLEDTDGVAAAMRAFISAW